MKGKPVEILSYGGGMQTIAMCVLVAQGKLPRPDYVIAADTGREVPSTWEYAREHAAPLLSRIGLDLHIAPHELATWSTGLAFRLTKSAGSKGKKAADTRCLT